MWVLNSCSFFSERGNALYLGKKLVKSFIWLSCLLCVFNNVAFHWEVLVQLTWKQCTSGLFFRGDE